MAQPRAYGLPQLASQLARDAALGPPSRGVHAAPLTTLASSAVVYPTSVIRAKISRAGGNAAVDDDVLRSPRTGMPTVLLRSQR
jgi:hypothetical protein